MSLTASASGLLLAFLLGLLGGLLLFLGSCFLLCRFLGRRLGSTPAASARNRHRRDGNFDHRFRLSHRRHFCFFLLFLFFVVFLQRFAVGAAVAKLVHLVIS